MKKIIIITYFDYKECIEYNLRALEYIALHSVKIERIEILDLIEPSLQLPW